MLFGTKYRKNSRGSEYNFSSAGCVEFIIDL